jgi:hypothetical protein
MSAPVAVVNGAVIVVIVLQVYSSEQKAMIADYSSCQIWAL